MWTRIRIMRDLLDLVPEGKKIRQQFAKKVPKTRKNTSSKLSRSKNCQVITTKSTVLYFVFSIFQHKCAVSSVIIIRDQRIYISDRRQCGGSGSVSVNSVSFPWIRIRINMIRIRHTDRRDSTPLRLRNLSLLCLQYTILQLPDCLTEQAGGEVGWANVWKKQGGCCPFYHWYIIFDLFVTVWWLENFVTQALWSLRQKVFSKVGTPFGKMDLIRNTCCQWTDVVVTKKKDENRRQGKGRRVCLGGRIYSIPCRASCFALVYLEETVEFNRFFQFDTDTTTFALPSVAILLLWVARSKKIWNADT